MMRGSGGVDGGGLVWRTGPPASTFSRLPIPKLGASVVGMRTQAEPSQSSRKVPIIWGFRLRASWAWRKHDPGLSANALCKRYGARRAPITADGAPDRPRCQDAPDRALGALPGLP